MGIEKGFERGKQERIKKMARLLALGLLGSLADLGAAQAAEPVKDKQATIEFLSAVKQGVADVLGHEVTPEEIRQYKEMMSAKLNAGDSEKTQEEPIQMAQK